MNNRHLVDMIRLTGLAKEIDTKFDPPYFRMRFGPYGWWGPWWGWN